MIMRGRLRRKCNACPLGRVVNRLHFAFENALELDVVDRKAVIHPDFMVEVGGRIYYGEHLGMLDDRDYYKDWQWRREVYEQTILATSSSLPTI
jgi:hypothetical protein